MVVLGELYGMYETEPGSNVLSSQLYISLNLHLFLKEIIIAHMNHELNKSIVILLNIAYLKSNQIFFIRII